MAIPRKHTCTHTNAMETIDTQLIPEAVRWTQREHPVLSKAHAVLSKLGKEAC